MHKTYQPVFDRIENAAAAAQKDEICRNRYKSPRGGRGFTLIELLVVVLIIGILAAVAVPQYQAMILKSRWMNMLSVGRSLVEAQHAFYLANGRYAEDLTLLDVQLPSGGAYTSHHGQPSSQVSYPDGSSYINTGSNFVDGWGSEFLLVSNSRYPEISLILLFPNREIWCRARIASKAATQACLSMGGVKRGYCDEGRNCWIYVIK